MPDINSDKKQKLDDFRKIFEEYNSHTNLMSKNDLSKIWTKHIPDSLNIDLFFKKYGIPKTIIDLGSGGGFPSVPIAIVYDKINVTAIESIQKKVRFLNLAKEKLNLDNYFPICDRVENLYTKLNNSADVVTSRAVADLSKIIEYSYPLLKKNGYIVAYKSNNADNELLNSEKLIKKYKLKFVEKIRYFVEDSTERELIIIRK